jgi:hypothetical protein
VGIGWRLRRAWHELAGPPPEDEQAEVRRRVRQRYRWWRRFRRVWRRRLRGLDPGKPPVSVLRWLAVLGIALTWWANGTPTSPLSEWLPYVVIAGVLILPDVAGFAVGGLRVDMRDAQDDIARLRQDVNAQARATSTSIVAFGNDAGDLIGRFTPGVIQAVRDQATGPGAPWPPPGTGEQPSQDVPS